MDAPTVGVLAELGSVHLVMIGDPCKRRTLSGPHGLPGRLPRVSRWPPPSECVTPVQTLRCCPTLKSHAAETQNPSPLTRPWLHGDQQ